MGKTLAKARKKLAREAQQIAQNGCFGGVHSGALAVIAKRLKYKLPINPKKKVKLVPIISEALNAKAWADALELLGLLEQKQNGADAEVPKLGAIMRWVRVADLAGTESIAARLLAGIMRVASGPQPHPAASDATPEASAGQDQARAGNDGAAGASLPVRRFAPWHPPSPDTVAALDTDTEGAQVANAEMTSIAAASYGPYAGRFAIVPLPPEYAGTNANGSTAGIAAVTTGSGAGGKSTATTLPNIARDLTMFCTEPGTIRFDVSRPPALRVEVPFVPGAFVLVGVLSRLECAQIVACAEEMGYTVDPDYTFSAAARAAAAGSGLSASASSAARSGGAGLGERGAAGCVWLADETLQGPLYDRVAHLLPQHLCGGDLAGINARWRLYRYDKGAVYRPHVDGAWPGSGIKDGRYEFDAYGDRWSRLTFLVYLNDDFEGGATTFYTPAQQGSGCCLEAHSVRPVAGNILVFPHGDTQGSLVHEGSAVTRGSKYVIRTEVLYKLAPGVKSGGVGAPQPAMQLTVGRATASAGAGIAKKRS
ncbi:hypothetical protein Vretimale_5604 [Volvox reticuliferus]|uniref:Fe2OG dioxygenase domain-containing protein n=1 Tax=Volvox reticuliferus TaxID=1737510 RepID=A0A8J4G5W3_9CHLO|nr:hypothetical protein Vretifemale_5629 [Volvox reticuliferus]GIL75924.1 hypothetical protein Vretifemale_5629 [Volvox reticuliferus]GIM00636.1 hypothetical protein Vretimale_5604 [Volvox reticuliferus]GIM00637.1 hypothetical protein Vretimale_5604 [Volvox reticuliferus]